VQREVERVIFQRASEVTGVDRVGLFKGGGRLECARLR
jgi:hypothetical protein